MIIRDEILESSQDKHRSKVKRSLVKGKWPVKIEKYSYTKISVWSCGQTAVNKFYKNKFR